MKNMQDDGYSVENAVDFGWASVSGILQSERVDHLNKYLVGTKVLDAGCGGGGYVDFLTKKGLDVTGLDKYPEFLNIGKQKGFQGSFVEGDVTAIPFPDKTFDCTYCFDVLEHVDDAVAIKELARVTKKRLIIAVPRKDDFLFKYGVTLSTYVDATHLRYYTEESLMSLAGMTNPTSVQIHPEIPVPFGMIFHEMLEKNVDQVAYGSDKIFIKNAIRRVFLFPMAKLKPLHSMYMSWLSSGESYRSVPLSLLGVIDLA